MHQKKYISEVLKKFNKMECNPAKTPTELNVKLVRSENETLVYGTLFKQIVGSLRFICHDPPLGHDRHTDYSFPSLASLSCTQQSITEHTHIHTHTHTLYIYIYIDKSIYIYLIPST